MRLMDVASIEEAEHIIGNKKYIGTKYVYLYQRDDGSEFQTEAIVPTRVTIHDTSKYMPHQGKQERQRRLRTN